MKIITTTPDNAERIAEIVSESNKDIARQFNINKDNNPKHPSFYTKKWVLSDFDRGEEYFIYKEKNINKGCVAFEQPNENMAYLNRLCVLPKYRHNGIGESLVNHILEYSKSKELQVVSIGIIAAHEVLRAWYSCLGFIEGATQKFDHLPFDVTYMQYEL
ncbi:MAG: GNAT family N-acetyltransferase [bacterium]|nr:GNAT family N-acetyltransferase [bacterium]